jgi:hypothetical protein
MIRAIFVLTACAGLAGCGHFHDHSHEVRGECIMVVGSNLCQDQTAADAATNTGSPGVNTSYTGPKD